MALSNRTGESEVSTASNPFMSRLDRTGPTTGERVAVDTLTNGVERLGVEHVSVLNINVAGSEPEMIEGPMPVLAQERVDVLILLIGRRRLRRIASSPPWVTDSSSFIPVPSDFTRSRASTTEG
jgi:hypothetical protein